ncbi:mCG145505, partial [Mus musculus]
IWKRNREAQWEGLERMVFLRRQNYSNSCAGREELTGARHELLTAPYLHLSSFPALLHPHPHYFRWLIKLKQSIWRSGAMFDHIASEESPLT